MTLASRIKIGLPIFVAAVLVVIGPAWLGYTIASGDAGIAAGSAVAAPVDTALPSPAEQPQESASMLWTLYKAGHLVPAIIVAAFFLLTLLQKWISWLRTGYRKLVVSSVLASLAMLAERAADGTTPNVTMIMGALGVGLAMWMNAKGEPKAAPPAVS